MRLRGCTRCEKEYDLDEFLVKIKSTGQTYQSGLCRDCAKEDGNVHIIELLNVDSQTVVLPEGIRRAKVEWILHNSCTDINYRTTVPQLSVEELEFCLKHEIRVTGRKQLLSELKKRKCAATSKTLESSYRD